jgi:hypothetical protein
MQIDMARMAKQREQMLHRVLARRDGEFVDERVLVAITATPPSGRKPAGSGAESMRTTRSTPRTFIAWVESTFLSVAPYTGERSTDA